MHAHNLFATRTKHMRRLRLFVTYKPLPTLRAVWHRLAIRTLRKSREGGWEGKNYSPRAIEVKNTFTSMVSCTAMWFIAISLVVRCICL